MKTYEQMTEEVLEKVKKEKARRHGAAKTAVSFALVLVLMIGTVLVAGQVGRAPGKIAPGGAQNGKPPVLKNEDPLTAGREYGEIYDLLKTNGFDPESGGRPIRGYGFDGLTWDDSVDVDAIEKEASSVGSVGYSKTNVQVEGIDEADVVKTDGKYVYAVSKSNVYIFSAEDGKMETVATIPFVGDDRSSVPLSGLRVGWGAPEIYVTDVRMIVVFSVYKPETDEQGNENPFYSFKQYVQSSVCQGCFVLPDCREPGGIVFRHDVSVI
ncbi:MAG: beta-propeller domain-containing protein, partial [Clostridia bacterium]|nr:beta-propeller domain-containing protein [Clostridia bacterium]